MSSKRVAIIEIGVMSPPSINRSLILSLTRLDIKYASLKLVIIHVSLNKTENMTHSNSHKICLTRLDLTYVSLDKTGEDKDYAGNEPSLHSGERLSLGRSRLCLLFVNNRL